MTKEINRSTLDAGRFRAEAARFSSLTSRERDVSIFAAKGLTDKQIAARLSMTAIAVRHDLTSVFRKLDIDSRFELILLCYRHRLVVFPNGGS